MPSPDFIDTELIFPIKPEETVAFTFNTLITERPLGDERRVLVRTEYRMAISIGTLVLRPSCGGVHEIDALHAFYDSVGGNKNTFKYKNFFDYKVTATPTQYNASPGFLVPSTYGVGQVVTGAPTRFQLLKVYEVFGRRTIKTLRLIDTTTLEVFVDGLQTFNFTIDPLLGQIEILDTLSGSEVITFSCEFYLEMRFAMGGLTSNESVGGNVKEVTGIELLEELTPGVHFGNSGDYDNIDGAKLKLPSIPRFVDNVNLEYKVASLQNKREQRQARYDELAHVYEYDANSQAEIEAWFLAVWFIVCKGRLLGFEFADEEQFARFDTDSFRLTLIALDTTGTGCGDVITIEKFSILGKEALLAPPELPSFILESPTFIDIGIGFTDTPQEPPDNFRNTTGSGSGGGEGGSSGGGGTGGGGFGGSSASAPVTIPTGFTPQVIGEISGLPVFLGTFNNTNSSNIYIAIPRLPYTGVFDLFPIGFDRIGMPSLFLYRNNTLHTIITGRPNDDNTVRQQICLEVFSDFSWQATVIHTSNITGSGATLSNRFYTTADTICFSDDVSAAGITGNNPSSINLSFLTRNVSGSELATLARSVPPFEKNRFNPLGQRYNENAIWWERTNREVREIQNDTIATAVDFGDASLGFNNRVTGGMDAAGNLGFIVSDLNLCDDVIDRDDLALCPNGAIVGHDCLFERLATEVDIRWVGSIPTSLSAAINIDRAVYFKRTIIVANTVVHIPTGIVIPLNDFGFSAPTTFGLINAGQNYVVALTGTTGNYTLYYLNFL